MSSDFSNLTLMLICLFIGLTIEGLFAAFAIWALLKFGRDIKKMGNRLSDSINALSLKIETNESKAQPVQTDQLPFE